MDMAYSPVPELNQLMAFQERTGFEAYAQGFGLLKYGDTTGLHAWSTAPGFLDRLVTFAQANGSGSFYALWRVDDRADLASLPVVAFGDEGGEHVVARNLRELLQLLGADTELTILHKDCYYYTDDEEEHTPSHDEYVSWLDDHFGLRPAEDTDAVLTTARAEYGDRFTSWVRQYRAE